MVSLVLNHMPEFLHKKQRLIVAFLLVINNGVLAYFIMGALVINLCVNH